MLTSWHFGAGQDILGIKYAFIEKSLKMGKSDFLVCNRTGHRLSSRYFKC